ncbi:metal ABC transporter permease [Mesobaculum littorinae]|uniref:Metal ABC transporter permease n=1 Tax=Mesobaculum littorinae TaxID=2486419 RepID=A0A438AK46_9RHOB|nr:metal ABC transporter permease [Mesobaculum littorinae]RVV99183.1 metal ABC transporter permease [Mesobaculum littorinae]
MADMLDLLSDYTIQTVAMGAALLGVSSGVLGCFAVLRRQSLLGDTLSHAALPGVCLGFLVAGTRDLGSILAGALVTGAAAALVVLALTRLSRLKTDAALGVALSVSFALGVVLLTYIQGTGNASQGGLNSFLFGQAAAILRSDLWIMGGIAAASLALVAALWKEFKLVSFDPGFATSLGLPVVVIEITMTVMVALAVVIGLQMVGVVLMTAMIVAPAVAARQWTRRLGSMVVLSAVFGTVAGVAGATLSATARGLSTGPLIVLAISAIVFVSLLLSPERGLLWEMARRWRDRRSLRGRQVLTTLHAMAAEHGDRSYPAELGSLDTYHGTDTRRVLARLEQRGLVRPVTHAPETTPHWELTPSGHVEARRLAADIEGHQ